MIKGMGMLSFCPIIQSTGNLDSETNEETLEKFKDSVSADDHFKDHEILFKMFYKLSHYNVDVIVVNIMPHKFIIKGTKWNKCASVFKQ